MKLVKHIGLFLWVLVTRILISLSMPLWIPLVVIALVVGGVSDCLADIWTETARHD